MLVILVRSMSFAATEMCGSNAACTVTDSALILLHVPLSCPCACASDFRTLAVHVPRWVFALDLHWSRFLISYLPGGVYFRSTKGNVFKAQCLFHKPSPLHSSCSVSFAIPVGAFGRPDSDLAQRKAAEWCCSAFKYGTVGDHINHTMPA